RWVAGLLAERCGLESFLGAFHGGSSGTHRAWALTPEATEANRAIDRRGRPAYARLPVRSGPSAALDSQRLPLGGELPRDDRGARRALPGDRGGDAGLGGFAAVEGGVGLRRGGRLGGGATGRPRAEASRRPGSLGRRGHGRGPGRAAPGPDRR